MNFKEKLESLQTAAFDTNETARGHITIKQGQRNKLRKELINDLYEYLQDQDFNVFVVENGVILNVENETIGDINIELKLSIKGLDFDLDEELEKFDIVQKQRAAKAAERAAKK